MKIAFQQFSAACLLMVLPLLSFIPPAKKAMNIVFIGDSITAGNKKATAPDKAIAYIKQHRRAGEIQFANHGVSGFTTVDFIPATSKAYPKVINTADAFYADKQAQLVFSIMLGTNDSAIEGPNGSPVSPENYGKNMQQIIDDLLKRYPGSEVIIHYPLWYSPNTYNRSKYLAEGLGRLQRYFSVIDALVKNYHTSNPGKVFAGDKKAFGYFKEHYQTDMLAENGQQGIFYLHPNEKGADKLGYYWSAAIAAAFLKK